MTDDGGFTMIPRTPAMLGAAIALASTTSAQVTVRVSVDSSGIPARQPSYNHASALSGNGRFVAFESDAGTLVPDDSNADTDVFVRDRRNGTTERVSVTGPGIQADGGGRLVSISRDGRFVTFDSFAANLVPGDTNGKWDTFVRDRWNGTTERASLTATGGESADHAFGGGSSDDGRFTVFVSFAGDFVPGDTNALLDVFVRDRVLGTTERVSVSTAGAQGHWAAYELEVDCAISADGRFVAFLSNLGGLVPGDTNFLPDTFVRDRVTNVTERVSVSSTGEQQNDWFGGFYSGCCISADGRFVGFGTIASNLVPGDTNNWFDGFVHDRLTRQTSLVTRGNTGNQASSFGGGIAGLSEDGRFAVFLAGADIGGGPPDRFDVFVRDVVHGSTRRMSVDAGGGASPLNNFSPSISPDGGSVAFATLAALVPDDTGGWLDIFVRDRLGGPSFESLCRPGADGVTSCPCDNPPAGGGRGCDNGAHTGGAVLSAAGATVLSSDSLVFTATDQTPSGVSILTAWSSPGAPGRTFGHGVLCTDGPFRRLYTKPVRGGAVTAPDFAAGDETVSSRSAELGDPIQPGERRWYVALYRDPGTPSACPRAAELNATQTGEVVWSP